MGPILAIKDGQNIAVSSKGTFLLIAEMKSQNREYARICAEKF